MSAIVQSPKRSVVVAYQSGDTGAYLRVIEHFAIKRPMAWDRPAAPVRMARIRRLVRERLATPTKARDEDDSLPLPDAQLLIARSYGFENWALLEQQTEAEHKQTHRQVD